MSNRLLFAVCAALAVMAGHEGHLSSAAAAPPSSWWDRMPALVTDAMAQEVMTFEEVPPESVAALEKRRASTRVRVGEAPPVPAVPRVPAVPPVPPVPPVPSISRAGDVVRIGSDIHIEENQVVDGDVFALQGDIRVDGHVKGNVATTGGDVRLGATARVDGDVMCIGGQLVEEPGAVVGGQRVTALRGQGEDRRISRKIRERFADRWDERSDRGGFAFALSWMLFTVLVAWSLARFIPGRTGVALKTLRDEPGASLLVGFVIVLLLIPSLVALALAVAVLCITIIGIPLALMLIPAYGLALTLLFLWGFALSVIVIGERFSPAMGGSRTLANSALVGAVIVSGLLFVSRVFHFIPFFGWVAALLWVLGFVVFGFSTLVGAGALLRSKFGQGAGGQWWPPFKRATAPAAPAPPVASAPSFAPAPPTPPGTYEGPAQEPPAP